VLGGERVLTYTITYKNIRNSIETTYGTILRVGLE
jgi:hypothetical protein